MQVQQDLRVVKVENIPQISCQLCNTVDQFSFTGACMCVCI